MLQLGLYKVLNMFKFIGLIRHFREEIEERIDEYHSKNPIKNRALRSNPLIGH
jgi:hypothetical protein